MCHARDSKLRRHGSCLGKKFEREREIDLIEVRTVPVEMHLQSVMCVEKRERLIEAQEGLKKA